MFRTDIGNLLSSISREHPIHTLNRQLPLLIEGVRLHKVALFRKEIKEAIKQIDAFYVQDTITLISNNGDHTYKLGLCGKYSHKWIREGDDINDPTISSYGSVFRACSNISLETCRIYLNGEQIHDISIFHNKKVCL